MEKDKTTKRTAYQVYVKIKGIWFEGSFPAKDCGQKDDYGAVTFDEVKAICGKTGNAWKITTTAKPLIQNE